ncbi:MAG: alpha/beta hydrolase [Candidatus Marinimicrobia bacterium]|nr:alpha/beta hydrolase [Candidatus Neomarinimicrobiota bacterium]
MRKTDYFSTDDGAKIAFICWLPKGSPLAAVQIAHGMAEHAARYEEFARYLCDRGIAVYANDHRGHGKTAGSPDRLGYFADENGWVKVVTDMRKLTKIIRNDYPKTPVFLFGHSMGSFLARTYITLYDDIHGAILSGTGDQSALTLSAGHALAYVHRKLYGAKKASVFFDNMSFGSFNKHFEDEGDLAWLSRDREKVNAYREDPYCGFVCTVGFFQDLFFGLRYISSKTHNRWIRITLPVLIMSGSEDPVGDFGKGPESVAGMYRELQLEEVDLKIYEGARHELTNETHRNRVYEDVYEWVKLHR